MVSSCVNSNDPMFYKDLSGQERLIAAMLTHAFTKVVYSLILSLAYWQSRANQILKNARLRGSKEFGQPYWRLRTDLPIINRLWWRDWMKRPRWKTKDLGRSTRHANIAPCWKVAPLVWLSLVVYSCRQLSRQRSEGQSGNDWWRNNNTSPSNRIKGPR